MELLMSFSIQRETSDGTLSTLDLTIEYLNKEDLTVYVDDQEIDLTGGVTPYTYEWVTDTQILITPDVANGLVVLVQRRTATSAMLHDFDAGAVFKDLSVDENFRQLLFLSQEAVEGVGATDFYTDINMHGYVIRNHGAATLDGDLVTFGQYRNDSLGAGFNRVAAEAARDAAVAAQAAAVLSENNASASASTASTQAGIATAQAVIASTQAGIATDSANAAALSETNAATSEIAAELAETNASASAADAAASAIGLEAMAVPIFSVHWCPSRDNVWPGYIPADGQLLDRLDYPDAWAGIAAGEVPTVADATWLSDATERGKFTEGNGSTTMRLPDYNGKFAGSLGAVFLRGDGTLSAAVAGAIQQDAMQGHKHGATYGVAGATSPTGSPYTQGVGGVGGDTVTGGYHISGMAAATGPQVLTGPPYSDGTNGTPRTASETRPLNVTGCWVIKLYGALVNIGLVDLAALVGDVGNLTNQVGDIDAVLDAINGEVI